MVEINQVGRTSHAASVKLLFTIQYKILCCFLISAATLHWIWLYRYTFTQTGYSGDHSTLTISILDDSQPPRPHPFAGARDEHGRWGYMHDPTYLKTHELGFTFHLPGKLLTSVCDTPLGEGEEGKHGMHGLKKIKIVTEDYLNKKRVLCIIYSHSERHERVRAAAETYGQRCDGFMAASNLTDRSIGAVDIPHEGPEDYDNMWNKVKSIWAYVHDHFIEDYDFFHIGGDNMFVVAENLRYAVSTMNVPEYEPIYVGGAIIDFPRQRRRYCGGGSGYTLNRVTLRALVQRYPIKDCWPNHTASDEDRIVASCLRFFVVNCTHNMDNKGEQRYHPLDAEFHAKWEKTHPSPWDWVGLLTWHNISTYKERLESISETTVSFHLFKDVQSKNMYNGLRRYHAIIYGYCPAFGDSMVQ